MIGLLIWRPWLSASERLFEQALAHASSEPAEAERRLKQAIAEADGHFADAQVLLARLRGKKRHWSEAQAVLVDAPLEKVQMQLLIDLGRDACAARQWELAEPVLEEVLRRSGPETQETLALLKGLYQQRGKFREMLEVAKRLVQMAPHDPRVLWGLGRTYEEMGLNPDAIATYRQVLESEMPSDIGLQIRQRLLELLLETGETAGARVELDRLVAQHGQSPDRRYYEAELCRMEGRSDESLEAIEQCLAEGGVSSQALLLRGLLRHEKGEIEIAVADFQKAVQADPFAESAHFKLADCYRRLGRDDIAKSHQAEYERIQGVRQEIFELKKSLRSRPDDGGARDRLRQLNDSLTSPSARR